MALVPFPGKDASARLPAIDPDDLEPESEDGGGAKMSFLEHLDELRRRLIVSIVAIGVGFLIALLFIDRIFGFIMRPLQKLLPAGSKMIYTEPTEAFMLQLKVAALAGLIIAAPVVMWQLWLFIAPGLYRSEKRFAVPFVFLTTFFFVGGAAFSHFVVFPLAWRFLASFGTDYMEFLPKITPVFGLYAKMLLIFGLVFQLPTVVFFLARMGLVTARFLLKNTKYAVLIIFIIAAVLTPTTDVVVQTLMAAPMLVLYLLSIGIAWLCGKKRRADEW